MHDLKTANDRLGYKPISLTKFYAWVGFITIAYFLVKFVAWFIYAQKVLATV